MNKFFLAILFAIFLLGFFLRTMFLPSLSLTFGYDQARDAVHAEEISQGHLKILGPPASTPGLFHGVFYYYVLAPAYKLGKGNPIVAAYWIAAINASAVFIIYYLTYLMTKKRSVGFLASFLFAISFEATQYATWLSNPTLAVFTVPLMYLGLWIWIYPDKTQRTKWSLLGPILTAIGLGLSIQSEIFLAYHIVPLIIWLYISRKKITKKQLVYFFIFLTLSLSTMILSEFKFGFRSISAIKSLLSTSEPNLAYAKSLGDYLTLYLNQISRIFAFNSYPGNIGYGGVLIVGIVIFSLKNFKNQKNKIDPKIFLSTWLLSHLSVVTVGGVATPFLMVGIGPAVSIILAIFLYSLWKKNYKPLSIFILVLLTYSNLGRIVSENKNGSTLFSIQKDMVLSKELKTIDFTYEKAQSEPFSINSVTSPLWINIVWSYLYNWYGMPKYGYIPTWHGKGQEGQIIVLPETQGKVNKNFLIIEPQDGIPPRFLDETLNTENFYSKLINETYFGTIRVQERVKI
ncbi:MAG: glycosyltransferase family 39 protein [Candidatus Woesebacteria bacterium]|nr:MAG: glycosyltransferase family 39 protein [Candidatus Woesebacteria bacterium]